MSGWFESRGDDSRMGGRSHEGSVVVGVDGSATSRLALKWAADEAKRHGWSLRVLHAQSGHQHEVPGWYTAEGSEISAGEAIIDDAVALATTRHPSVLVRGEAVDEAAALVLAEASRSADLLVVGSRGLGGFGELLLGSVSDQCLQHAHCPVAVVHADDDEIPYQTFDSRIVVGLDGSLESALALRWAIAEAHLRSASVEAIHAWQYPPIGSFLPPSHQGAEDLAQELLDAAVEHAQRLAPDVPFAARRSLGATIPVLLEGSGGAALLVLGARGHGRFPDMLLGSVAHQCARHASCTVVVVRTPMGDRHW